MAIRDQLREDIRAGNFHGAVDKVMAREFYNAPQGTVEQVMQPTIVINLSFSRGESAADVLQRLGEEMSSLADRISRDNAEIRRKLDAQALGDDVPIDYDLEDTWQSDAPEDIVKGTVVDPVNVEKMRHRVAVEERKASGETVEDCIDCKRKDSALTHMKRQMQSLTRQRDNIEKDRNLQAQSRKKAEQKADDFFNKMRRLNTALDAKSQHIDDLKQQLRESEDRVGHFRYGMQDMADVIEELERDKERLEADVEALKAGSNHE